MTYTVHGRVSHMETIPHDKPDRHSGDVKIANRKERNRGELSQESTGGNDLFSTTGSNKRFERSTKKSMEPC